MMNENKPELLTPAGSPAALQAAVSCGADAVYLGCSEFANARMNAENFTKKTLAEALDFCHSRDVKGYVTLNTLLSDRETEQLASYVSFLYENGADGVIVQEPGVMEFLQRYFPSLPVHASTQAGIANTAGLAAAKKLGCTRAVAARELSMQEIEALCREPIEIEVFVHGALCACYSGFCLMSSMIGRRSGNRGKCAQPCRLPYSVDGKKPVLLMNLKDNMLIQHLDSLAKIGVRSLKIEGRMKGPDYVGFVTSCYRRALDGETLSETELKQLTGIFDRGGYTDGYYHPTKKTMFAYAKPKTPYQFQPELPKTEKKIPVMMHGILQNNLPFQLTVSDSAGNRATAEGVTPAFIAEKQPLCEDTVKERLKKLGDTPYRLQECTLSLEQGLMIPLGEIARIKRQACETLTALRIGSYKRSLAELPNPEFRPPVSGFTARSLKWTATVDTYEQYRAIRELGFEWIAVPLSVLWNHRQEIDPSAVVRLPAVAHEMRMKQIREQTEQLRKLGFSSLLCGNTGDFYGFPNWDKKGDLTLWLYNSLTAETLSEQHPSSLCLSPEMNLGQIRDLQCSVPCEALLYGRIPLMRTKHCFVKSSRGNCKGECTVTDRTKTQFPVRCVGGEHILYNSAPVFMGDKRSDLQNTCVAYGRIAFTTESPAACITISREIMNGTPYQGSKTRGHYYRGV